MKRGRKRLFHDDDAFDAILLLYGRDWSSNKIARLLRVEPSTIQMEFRRRGFPMRLGSEAQQAILRYKQRRNERGS
jgi:IS30 family transposase